MQKTRLATTTSATQRVGMLALATAALALLGACSSMGPSVSSQTAPTLSPTRIAEIIASPDRTEADRRNDVRRKPAEMLQFIGIRPGIVALDVSAGGGYTTELIARSAGSAGRVYGQTPPRTNRPGPAQPEGAAAPPMAAARPAPVPPAMSAATAPRPALTGLAARAANPMAGNIVAVVQPFEKPVPPAVAPASLDLVTLMFNYHDLGHLGVDRTQMNRALFAALKPGGIYVIADHSGRPGTGISESGTLHRVEEAFVRNEVESAGFKLVSTGDFLRNPADPRDQNTPNPPMPKDEFVLKFVRP
jgi:predicted methyltransferase